LGDNLRLELHPPSPPPLPNSGTATYFLQQTLRHCEIRKKTFQLTFSFPKGKLCAASKLAFPAHEEPTQIFAQ
jgi:hypothetical protein